jgi:uncharacterized membrane protein
MMWLILFGFAAVLYQLYGRVRQLEGQIAELELLPYAPPEPERQPAAAKVLTRPPETAAPPFEPEAEVAMATEPLPEFVPEPEPEPDHSMADDEAEAGHFALQDRKFDFEDLFGRRLPIWAGGITLALAGYSSSASRSRRGC